MNHFSDGNLVVIGGGIAGVCCVQELARIAQQNQFVNRFQLILVTFEDIVKIPMNFVNYSTSAQSFDVKIANLKVYFLIEGMVELGFFRAKWSLGDQS